MSVASTEKLLPDGAPNGPRPLAEIAREFFWLGCTSFGGPPVHFGMFQTRLIEKLQWMSHERYVELMAMAACLPGPSSTQTAFAIGIVEAGTVGGLISGFCFAIPGMFIMTACGLLSNQLQDQIADKTSVTYAVAAAGSAVGVALVFSAASMLVKKAAQGPKLGTICFCTTAVCVVATPAPGWLNAVLIFLGGIASYLWPSAPGVAAAKDGSRGQGRTGIPTGAAVLIFVLYLVVGAAATYDSASGDKGWFIGFLSAGLFVWGGGPVVLPFLLTVLTPEWVNVTVFTVGIALAEMCPGPVFNLSCFLGAQIDTGHHWIYGTLLAWVGLMGPGVSLTFGAVPLWDKLRNFAFYNKALPGLNAAAVGLLVSTVFLVYGKVDELSPYKPASRAIMILSWAATEHVKVSVPVVVLVAGVAAALWVQAGSPVYGAV